MEGVYDAPALADLCADHPDRWDTLQKNAVGIAAEKIDQFSGGLRMARQGSADLAVVTYAILTDDRNDNELLDAVLSGWNGGLIEGVTAARR